MGAETGIGGTGNVFPPTRHSIVLATKSGDATIRGQAFEELIAVYWKPVYKYIRMKWQASREDAMDLTQEFFAAAFEKEFFDSFDAGKSKFRTFLRICVDGLVANARKASTRIKRGGQTQIVTLDFEAAEHELSQIRIGHRNDLEELFDREWVRSLFTLAVDDLRQQCRASGKLKHFALFERYDLEPDNPTSYAELAREFQLPVTQVTNYLAFARSEFRRHVLNRLRRITGSDSEFRSEARRLLGVDPR